MLGKYIAQPTTVSRKVTDATGDPLPSVNVVVKGTQTGVITDADGNFSISATRGDVLTLPIFSMRIRKLRWQILNLTIVLKEGSTVLKGDIVFVRNRTFAGRIFHSIGNLFR